MAQPVVSLALPSLFKSGTFLHIREDRTSSLKQACLSPETWSWLWRETAPALTKAGYDITEKQLSETAINFAADASIADKKAKAAAVQAEKEAKAATSSKTVSSKIDDAPTFTKEVLKIGSGPVPRKGQKVCRKVHHRRVSSPDELLSLT